MALTIAIEGKGVIANADAISDSAGGTWTEQGGGTIAVSNDVFLIGSASIGGKYASKSGFHQYDIGSGNELDFTATTGSEEGQCLYIWVSMTALGTLDALSTYPLAVRLSRSSPGTSDYVDYVIAGNDDKNGWDGGFRCFVIDPTKTPTRADNSTYTNAQIIASVRTMGIWIDCSTSARADSIFVDQMAVGSGVRVTGTSTTGWKDVVDYCTDYSTRGWGMWQEREGIYYTYGKTIIGDDATPQSAAVSFTDSGRIIQFGFTEYCTNVSTGTWANSMSADFSGVKIEDDSATTTGVTTFKDGVFITGTEKGRSGSSFIGNSSMDVTMDLYGGSNTSSVTGLYGTILKDITGAINSGNDANHEFFSCSLSGCSQFDPVGAPAIRNCLFVETNDTAGSLLWNSSIDVEDCAFIANSLGAGIEHDTWNGTNSGTSTNTTVDADTTILKCASTTGISINDIVYNEADESFGRVTAIDSSTQITHTALAGGTNDYWTNGDAYSVATPYSYTNLTFSGNTYDIDNTTSPANVVAISKAGTSDPSSYATGEFVAIQGSVTVQVTVKDTNGDEIENAQVGIFKTSDGAQLMNELSNASGVASETYAGTTPVEVEVRVRKSSTGTRYIPYSSIQNIQSGTGLTLDVTLRTDPNIS